MSQDEPQHDLILLTAGKNEEMTLRGIFSRPEALGIRPVVVHYIRHPEHDPGCALRAPDLLRPFLRSHRYALVICDHDGSGRENLPRTDLERHIEQHLAQSGWTGRSAAIVVNPELEIWVWSDSAEVDAELGWAGREPNLRQWLRTEGLLPGDSLKPTQPKETLHKALQMARKPRSSSLYRQLAQKVSFKRCTDPAFEKLKKTLKDWFPGN